MKREGIRFRAWRVFRGDGSFGRPGVSKASTSDRWSRFVRHEGSPDGNSWRWEWSFLAILMSWMVGCSVSETRPTSYKPDSGAASIGSVPPDAWSREVDRWLGTPYVRGGSGKEGADCSGFVQQVYERVAGVNLPRVTQDQFRVGFEVTRSELRPGDLVFFETTGAGVSHVGVMVGGDRFAHASTSKGVVYSRLSEAYWGSRYLGARRLPRRNRRQRSVGRLRVAKSFDTPESLPADSRAGRPVICL